MSFLEKLEYLIEEAFGEGTPHQEVLNGLVHHTNEVKAKADVADPNAASSAETGAAVADETSDPNDPVSQTAPTIQPTSVENGEVDSQK